MRAAILTTFLLTALPVAAQDSSRRRDQLLAKLDLQRITLNLKDAPLRKALDGFREAAGIDVEVDPKCFGTEFRVNLQLRDVSPRTVLKMMLQNSGLTATIREGGLLILPKSSLKPSRTTRIYDVRDMTSRLQDFLTPVIDFRRDPLRAGWMG